MSWEWNASGEGGENAYQNIHNLSREVLCECLAEFAANEKQRKFLGNRIPDREEFLARLKKEMP